MAGSTCKITNKLRTKLCGISNRDCILIQLLNEEEKFAIAYPAWIKGEVDLIDAQLEETEVKLYWPLDVTVKYSKTLKQQLESCKFTEKLAIIKAQGEWPKLSEQMKNLQSFGKLDISKGSRKRIAQQNRVVLEGVKATKQTSKACKQAKKEAAAAKNKKILKAMKRKQNSRVNDSDESSSTETEQVLDTSDQEDGAEAAKNSKILKAIKRKQNSRVSDSDESSSTEPEQVLDTSGQQDLHAYTSPLAPSGSSKFPRLFANDSNNPRSTSTPKPIEFIDNMENESTNIKLEFTNNKNDGIRRSYPLHPRILKNIPKNSPKAYICGLCDNFFAPEYLVTHSATGKATNANPTAAVKPAVDTNTVVYIKEKVEEHFGHVKKLDSLVNKVLSTKIAAARTAKKHEEERQQKMKLQRETYE